MNLSLRMLVGLALAAGASWAQELGQRPWPESDRLEEFLVQGEIVARARLVTGVTESTKVTLQLGDERHEAIFKKIDEPNDSWRHEVAAYELDKLLGLGMVPPTVRRKDKGKLGCLQLWVEGVTLDQLDQPPPDLEGWRRQVSAMWLFDYLTANNDRHANNVLASPDYRLLMIDNSRAFAQFSTPLRTMTQTGGATRALFWISDFDPDLSHYETSYSPELVERLRALNDDELKSALGSFVDRSERSRLLARRDTILQTIASLHPKSAGSR